MKRTAVLSFWGVSNSLRRRLCSSWSMTSSIRVSCWSISSTATSLGFLLLDIGWFLLLILSLRTPTLGRTPIGRRTPTLGRTPIGRRTPTLGRLLRQGFVGYFYHQRKLLFT